MRKSIRHLVLTAMVSVQACTAWAQTTPAYNHPAISKKWHVLYDVSKDASTTEVVTMQHQILHESALESLKSYSFSFSTSIQNGEVVEAFTEKGDGRRIPVPATNFQTQINSGRGQDGPAFSDRTRITIVFPDLAVGDTVAATYRIVEKEAMFPGRFSQAITLSPFAVYEDVQVTVRAPAELKLAYEAHNFQGGQTGAVDAQGKQTTQWTMRQVEPRRWNEDDQGIWTLQEQPTILISNFPDYDAIAKAYGERALPKAAVTPRVKELATQIVGKETEPRRKAQSVYEWVSKNITYGGNCIGVGAVVPRDIDVVLGNKMGDCKDHATLLQALLTAVGIRSEQVLINSGGQYELARTPVVSMVNHVMNFLPDFKLYVDATAKEIPFGYLPTDSNAKPVIHVGSANVLAVTPSQRHELTQQRLKMKLSVADDGSARGHMQVSLHGLAAASARAYLRSLSGNSQQDFVKNALSSYGYRGQGTVDTGDTTGMSDQHAYTMTFTIDNFLKKGATGAFILAPVMDTPHPVMNFANATERPLSKRRQACYGFHSYEEYDIELPPSMALISLPADAQSSGKLLDFKAKYQKTKTGLKVNREVHDKTPDSICSVETMNALHAQTAVASENLATQVLYRRSK